MMCAYTAACGGAQVVLLEPNRQLGRKVRITGKGRCNVTNDCDTKTFLQNVTGDGRFLYSALSRFAPQALHPKAVCTGGVLEEECRQLMQEFFRSRR